VTRIGIRTALVLLAVGAFVSPATAANPSFACTGTLSLTEKIICADDGLAALDRAVATAYRNKFDGLPVESGDALEEVVQSLVMTQKAWLTYRDACGADRTCIYRVYAVRKAGLAPGDGVKDTPCRDTVGAEQAAVFVKQCLAVASETYPHCNSETACEPILSHTLFRCAGLGASAPKFCAAYRPSELGH
jgi:uncharacterized protein YecT (DUF1311 family)